MLLKSGPPHCHHHLLRFPLPKPLSTATATATSIPISPASFLPLLAGHRSLPHLRQLHALAVTAALSADPAVANRLLYSYAQHSLAPALLLFHHLRRRDNVSWSILAGALSRSGRHLACLRAFRAFLRSRALPDNFTLPSALRSCRSLTSLELGAQLHPVVFKAGLAGDVFVAAALVDMYAKCGSVDGARKVFDRMPKRDMVTWTVMISGYAEGANPEEALALFHRMRAEGVAPDKVTMVAVVSACTNLGAMHMAQAVHEYLAGIGMSLNVFLGSAMIEMYAKCGSVEAAREIFDQMAERNVITWSSMISAYGVHGRGKEALALFRQMVDTGIRPNRITFAAVLYACSHAGLVEEGRRLLDSMERDYLIRPDVKHYTCMIDLLGRAGKLEEAVELSERVALERDEGFWGALLGACRIHGDIGLAEKAARSLLELRPRNAGYYVLLSNIYAKAGRWDDVARMRDLMSSKQLKKTPGWTWIEINGKTYQFRVGDKSHPQSKEIYRMLDILKEKLELAGYVPDTDFVLHDIDEELKPGFLYSHSEKLAIAFGLIATPEKSTLRITKNLRVCGDCHTFTKFVSAVMQRVIIVRDANRFHHFKGGSCSCGDYW